jgi:hypothetical protein
MRNVAMFASAGFIKSNDFHAAWPVGNSVVNDTVLLTDEDRERILKIHNIKG